MENIKKCKCGNDLISVIETISGTMIYCSICGRSTKRYRRAAAVQAWNERLIYKRDR